MPDPPTVDGVPAESFVQALQGLTWTLWRRPFLFVGLLTVVGDLCLFALAMFALPIVGGVLAPVIIAFAVMPFFALVLVVIVVEIRRHRRRRHTYASEEARLAIAVTSRGWVIADHIARPGAVDAGRRLRLAIRDQLIAEADRHDVVVYATTTSEKLARRYLEDIPGLVIASHRHRRIDLVRLPAQRVVSEHP